MKVRLIEEEDLEELSPMFKGKVGHKIARIAMHVFAVDKVNWVYDHSIDYRGADFADRLLEDIGVEYRIGNPERLEQLPDGAFITISNHPYGALDGIMMIDLMARVRPDYKLMVNKFLSKIKTMDDNFISVIPKVANRDGMSMTSLNGIRETLSRLKDEHPVGFFPSGAVSDFKLNNFRIRDREWQESVLKLIKAAKVPVVPIRFFNNNSIFFYLLGLINWRIRSLRMPAEVFNKAGQRPRISVGETVSVEEQEKYTDLKSFGNMLREKVYGMPLPSDFVLKSQL